jgi:hypothetical protein
MTNSSISFQLLKQACLNEKSIILLIDSALTDRKMLVVSDQVGEKTHLIDQYWA